MTIVKYPDNLTPLMRDSKQVQRVSGYETADPLYGTPYVRVTTNDTPTIISGTFRFTRSHARAFQRFLLSIRNGLDPFIIPIDSERGVWPQTVQAMPGSFQPSQQGEVFSYNVTLVIREWAYDPMWDYEDTFIDIGWDISVDFGIFDKAVNWGLTGHGNK